MEVSEREPADLHKLIWRDGHEQLSKLLDQLNSNVDVDSLDTPSQLLINSRLRGITPLCLALMLGRRGCVKTLLEHGASCLVATSAGYYPVSEAISLGDREILQWVVEARFREVREMVRRRQPKLFASLSDQLRDFYIELKWKFHSWVPGLALLLPHDTCRLWKRGNRVRIDTTLMGFEGITWSRGNLSFIFEVSPEYNRCFIIDHDRKIFDEAEKLRDYEREEMEADINAFLNVNIVNGKLYKTAKDGSPIQFDLRQKRSGWFGTGSPIGPVEEVISGYPCRVYDIRNVRWITRTRREHLRDRKANNNDADADKDIEDSDDTPDEEVEGNDDNLHEEMKDNDDNLHEEVEGSSEESTSQEEEAAAKEQEIRNVVEEMRKAKAKHAPSLQPPPPPAMSFEEFFDPNKSEDYIHVGRPLDLKIKEKTMRARVWMADNFPMTVNELIPLLSLAAPTNKQFRKLVDFVESDLPGGFPVQLDIPVFAFLSAVATFGNFREANDDFDEKPVTRPSDDPETWFSVPEDYTQGVVIRNIFDKD